MIECSGSLDIYNFTLDVSRDYRLTLSSYATYLDWFAVGLHIAFDEYLVPGKIDKPGLPGVGIGNGIRYGGVIGMGDKLY
jgi:hypothetical protein